MTRPFSLVNMGMARSFKQGHYEVQNTDKYVGTNTSPRYLSSLELEVFRWCDRSPDVLKWGAEVVVVPYYNPVKGRKARYMVDVFIHYRDKAGNKHTELVEIKPMSQSRPPKKTKNKRIDVFESELATWNQNQAKWQAASNYAAERNWKFRVITEQGIRGKKKPKKRR